jgi:hypothetical protein
MKHMSLMVLSASILMGLAPSEAQNVHPSPSDLARAFETIDVVLARIADPLNSVSSALSQADAGKNRQRLNDSVQGVVHRWAAIVTVSNGRELPVASDLFFIYTEMLDLQSYIDSVTNDKRMPEQPRDIMVAATALVRANGELLPVIETLRYAAADRIDAEEARCLPHTSGHQR